MEIVMVITSLLGGRNGCAGFWIKKGMSGIETREVIAYYNDRTVDKIINIFHKNSGVLLGTALKTYGFKGNKEETYPYDSVFCPSEDTIIADTILAPIEELKYYFSPNEELK